MERHKEKMVNLLCCTAPYNLKPWLLLEQKGSALMLTKLDMKYFHRLVNRDDLVSRQKYIFFANKYDDLGLPVEPYVELQALLQDKIPVGVYLLPLGTFGCQMFRIGILFCDLIKELGPSFAYCMLTQGFDSSRTSPQRVWPRFVHQDG